MKMFQTRLLRNALCQFGIFYFLTLLSPGISSLHGATWQRMERTEPAMGTQVRMVLVVQNRKRGHAAMEAAFERVHLLDRLLSDYRDTSELSLLSQTAGSNRAVRVSDAMWQLLSLSNRLSEQTAGAFDITAGPLVRLWRRARRRQELPTKQRLAQAKEAVGWHHLHLDSKQKTAQLAQPNMRLDLGGIAKGYVADQALQILKEHGVPRALVDAGGDLALGDPPPEKKGWVIRVRPTEGPHPSDRQLVLANVGVATSGDAYQYVNIGGVRYSHLVDPRTGMAISTPFSVTVIAPNGCQADAWASALSLLGPEKGTPLLEAADNLTAFFSSSE